MFETIEFMSGVFAFFGLGMLIFMVIDVLVTLFDGPSKQEFISSLKFCGALIIGSLILCSFSVFTHWIYSTKYEIPRREHIEYFLNHQNEFRVDSVRRNNDFETHIKYKVIEK